MSACWQQSHCLTMMAVATTMTTCHVMLLSRRLARVDTRANQQLRREAHIRVTSWQKQSTNWVPLCGCVFAWLLIRKTVFCCAGLFVNLHGGTLLLFYDSSRNCTAVHSKPT